MGIFGLTLLLGCAGVSHAANVDFFVSASSAAAPPGGHTTLTYRIGNQSLSSSGAIQLTVVTAPYVNIDRTVALPPGCTFLYQNLDRVVPEIIACVLQAGLGPGAQRSFSLGMTVDLRAPGGQTTGLATVRPADTSGDVDIDLLTNTSYGSINVARATTPLVGQTNLALSSDASAIGAATPASRTLVLTNNGPDATAGSAVLSFRTASYVNVDRNRPLPDGCQLLYENANPGVPEIVRCVIPAGIEAGVSRTLSIPLALVPGGPVRFALDSAAVRVDEASGDRDPDNEDNIAVGNLTMLGPGTASPPIAMPALPLEMPPPASGTPPAPAAAGPGAAVDLFVSQVAQPAMPGGLTTAVFTIGNAGAGSTAKVRLVYSLPLFANIDRGSPMPEGCHFLFEDDDFTVQEIVECIVLGMPHGQTRTLTLTLAISPVAPRGATSGIMIVQPVPESADVEQFLADNFGFALLSVLRGAPVTPSEGHPVDLYLTSNVYPNVLTNRPGTETLVITNRGPEATQGITRVTFATPIFVNVDRTREWPVGCRFLYENADLAVPEIVECLIDAPIPAGGEVRVPIPLRVVAGAPAGFVGGTAMVRPALGSDDVEQVFIDNSVSAGVVVSELPAHPIRYFLQTTAAPLPAHGLAMTRARAPGLLMVNILNEQRWFSVPALVGAFDAEAQFRVVTPCLLGLGLGVTYRLSTTAPNGSDERLLGETSVPPLFLCLGQRAVAIPVLAPVLLDERRLKLTVQTLLGLNLPLGNNTYLEATAFRGTP